MNRLGRHGDRRGGTRGATRVALFLLTAAFGAASAWMFVHRQEGWAYRIVPQAEAYVPREIPSITGFDPAGRGLRAARVARRGSELAFRRRDPAATRDHRRPAPPAREGQRPRRAGARIHDRRASRGADVLERRHDALGRGAPATRRVRGHGFRLPARARRRRARHARRGGTRAAGARRRHRVALRAALALPLSAAPPAGRRPAARLRGAAGVGAVSARGGRRGEDPLRELRRDPDLVRNGRRDRDTYRGRGRDARRRPAREPHLRGGLVSGTPALRVLRSEPEYVRDPRRPERAPARHDRDRDAAPRGARTTRSSPASPWTGASRPFPTPSCSGSPT